MTDPSSMHGRAVPDLMTVAEVADYLRVGQRTVYELVRTRRIPTARLSGKLLFPRLLIELWVAQSADYPQAAAHLSAPPPVIAGSHDPLLEWAARESKCELAILVNGSSAGLHRLLARQAAACALHILDPATGEYDPSFLIKSFPNLDFVVVEWARRNQGLVVASGNPAKILSIEDVRRRGVRVAIRQEGSGSAMLFSKLLADAGLKPHHVTTAGEAVSSETDVALAVRDGKADIGLAIEAVARENSLDFIAVQWERFDLVMRHADYFEPPMQRLLSFARTDAFRERAAALAGYDVSATGAIVYTARR
jgi:excisionase family DNA binding protein